MRLLKQLVVVFAALGILGGGLMIFSYDIIKIDWMVFMELQPSYGTQEFDMETGAGPRPVPALSIPVEGPAYIPGNGAPANPVKADETSLARGKQLFETHCAVCHGVDGKGTGTVAAFFTKKKPANLTSPEIQAKSDGEFFLTVSNGFSSDGKNTYMPALRENLTVRERWDAVNFIRTLKP